MKANKTISNRQRLEQRLRELREEKQALETSITKHSEHLYTVVTNPGPIIKSTVSELAKDRQFKSEVLQIAVHAAANYIGKKIASSDLFHSFSDTTKQPKSESGTESAANTTKTDQTKRPSLLTEFISILKNRYANED